MAEVPSEGGSEADLPFSPNARNLIEDEVVDSSIDVADIRFEELMKIVIEDDVSRGVEFLHIWHRLTRHLIDHGVLSQDLQGAVRKVARESRKARRIEPA